MGNTVSAHAARAFPRVAIATITKAQFLAASTANRVEVILPIGVTVTGGALIVKTAFNTTSTDTVTVGDSGSANRLLGATSIKSAARTALVPTGYVTTSSTCHIYITRTPADNDATVGDLVVLIEYVNATPGIVSDEVCE